MHKSESLKDLFIGIDVKSYAFDSVTKEILEIWWPSWRDNKTLKVNNFISADFQTKVSIWFLFSMKLFIRIINKKSRTYCQRHPTNLLAKEPKTNTIRLHATYPMTLNCQAYMKKFLLSLDTSKVTKNSSKISYGWSWSIGPSGLHGYDRARNVHANGVTRTRKFVDSIDFSAEFLFYFLFHFPPKLQL